MILAGAVLSGFLIALLVGQIWRAGGRGAAWAAAAFALGLAAGFGRLFPAVLAGEVPTVSWEWLPGMDVVFSLRADGLGVVFALLVTAAGTLIFTYGGAYLAGRSDLGRFFALMVLFMASMLGLVLAADLITLFVFWELTSISSFLLIGFEHERREARGAALQALVVTVLGGLAMLAGVIVLGTIAGTYTLDGLTRRSEQLQTHPHAIWALILILVGAFTKSAQVPLHFWLPGAMVAPTPVSAYLHSATMVKAGVFLLLRVLPIFGQLPAWEAVIVPVGIATYLWASFTAVLQDDLKALLAYATVASLGLASALAGAGGEAGLAGAVVFLLVHGAYKGTLFLAAGTLDHELDTRRLSELGGAGRRLPVTGVAATTAVLSMVAVPGLGGYLAKDATARGLGEGGAVVLFIGGALTAAYGWRILSALWGRGPRGRRHEPALLVAPAALLAAAGVVAGVVPAVLEAVAAALGIEVSLWPGLGAVKVVSGTAPLLVGALTAGVILHRGLPGRLAAVSGAALFDRLYNVLLRSAGRLTARQLTGHLRDYLMVVLIVAVTGVLAGAGSVDLRLPEVDLQSYEVLILLLVAGAVLTAVLARLMLTSVIAMGAVGYTVGLLFLVMRAPDLALTQVLVETVMLVLLLAVVTHLDTPELPNRHAHPWLDVVVAAGAGLMALVVAIQAHPGPQSLHLPEFFVREAETAGGHNLVNLILVDFRALDTLGEITVLMIAALGVIALASRRPLP